MIKRLDKLARDFIWKGDDAETKSSGHCLVRWSMVQRPKELGGLGIKDLEKFGKALRQRWLWHNWNQVDKSWKGLQVPCTKEERNLFAENARIQIGDGKSTLFWHDSWIGQRPLKLSLPNLFQVARFKNRTVAKEMTNNNWIRSVRNITTTPQIREYVLLWNSLSEVTLNEDNTDSAVWTKSDSGVYNATSAYKAQFKHTTRPFKTKRLWKAKAEPKVILFAWTAMHEKVLTADVLEAKGWDDNVICPLCLQELETNHHLLIDCSFARQVLHLVNTWQAGPDLSLMPATTGRGGELAATYHQPDDGCTKERPNRQSSLYLVEHLEGAKS